MLLRRFWSRLIETYTFLPTPFEPEKCNKKSIFTRNLRSLNLDISFYNIRFQAKDKEHWLLFFIYLWLQGEYLDAFFS